jgi:RNA-binding protein
MTDAPTDTPAQTPLTGRQRRHLRGLANPIKPIVHVGESGISDAVVKATNAALRDHELIKVKLHQPPDKKATATALSEQTGAELCGLVGHTVILFRSDPENPKIELPAPHDPS